jgi:hypothetical protein
MLRSVTVVVLIIPFRLSSEKFRPPTSPDKVLTRCYRLARVNMKHLLRK